MCVINNSVEEQAYIVRGWPKCLIIAEKTTITYVDLFSC